MTIGQRIKARRLELGLTQEDLAKRLGNKSRASVCTVEKDKEDLTTTRIRQYAEALSCTPAYLMGWEGGVSEAEFDDYFEKTGETSRLKTYLDAFAKLSPRSQEEVLNYIDYQRSKDDTKKD